MGKVKCRHCGKGFDSRDSMEQHSADKHVQAGTDTVSNAGLPSRKMWATFAFLLIAAACFAAYMYLSSNSITGLQSAVVGKHDEFAKCLTEKGVTMYGSYLCSHCLNQKKAFGSSWKYVSYVECSPDGENAKPELCEQQGISSYPTWVYNGEKRTGEQSLLSLSIWSGCLLE